MKHWDRSKTLWVGLITDELSSYTFNFTHVLNVLLEITFHFNLTVREIQVKQTCFSSSYLSRKRMKLTKGGALREEPDKLSVMSQVLLLNIQIRPEIMLNNHTNTSEGQTVV